MQYRTTLALLCVAVGMVAYILLVERHQPTSDDLYDREVQGRILDASWDQITHLSITRAGATVELERVKEPGEWKVVKPMSGKASTQLVGDIVTRFGFFREKSRLPPPPNGKPYDLAEFGLAPPLITATIRYGDKSATVRLGKQIAVGTDRYAQLDGVDHVFLVDPGLFLALDKSPAELMDRKIFDLDFTKLGGITLEATSADGGTKGKVELAREQEVWTIEGDRSLPIDRTEMERLGATLRGLEAVDLLDAAGFDAAKAGLAEPRLRATVREEKNGKSVTLAIGAPVPDKPDLVYARIGDGPGAITLKADQAAILAPELNRLRSKIYFDLPDSLLQRVVVETPAGKTVLKLDGDTWTAESPAGLPIDYGSVHNFLMRIRVFTVVQFVGAAEGDLARYGLASPRFSLTLTYRYKDRPAPADLVYRIGWTDAQPENVMAITGDGKEIVRLDPAAKDLYARGALSFRRPDLLSVPRERLTEFAIERRLPAANGAPSTQTRKQVCTHPADDPEGWQVTEDGQTKTVPPASVAAVVDRLTQVWAVDFAADHPSSLVPYGLDQPEIVVTLHYHSDATAPPVTEKILLGAKSPEGTRYCMLGSASIVFTWDEETFRLFERDLTLPPPEEDPAKTNPMNSGS